MFMLSYKTCYVINMLICCLCCYITCYVMLSYITCYVMLYNMLRLCHVVI